MFNLCFRNWWKKIVLLTHTLKTKFSSVFLNDLQYCIKVKASLKWKENVKPIFRSKCPVPYTTFAMVNKILYHLQRAGVIQLVNYLWVDPIGFTSVSSYQWRNLLFNVCPHCCLPSDGSWFFVVSYNKYCGSGFTVFHLAMSAGANFQQMMTTRLIELGGLASFFSLSLSPLWYQLLICFLGF